MTRYNQYVYIDGHCRMPNVYHGPIGPYGYPMHPHPPKGTLCEINTASPTVYIRKKLDGTYETKFHVNMIDLMDRVFIHRGMKFLSEDQIDYVSKYFEQAGLATDKLNLNLQDPFNNMDETFKDFDEFLGNYYGVDGNEYSRL